MPVKRWRLLLAGAAAVLFAICAVAATPPSLGAAASFAAFGSSGVSNSGPTRVTGNVGASPGGTVSGFPPGTIATGALITDSGTLRQAQRDAAAAYAQLAALQPCTPLLASPLPLKPAPGVYCVSALAPSLALEDTDSDVWIFLVPSSLTTSSAFSVQLLGGATSSNVFWQVDGALTIGANGAFVGTILARTDIHLLHAAALSGRALAPNGSVTFDTNDVTFCCDPLGFDPEALPPLRVDEPYTQTIKVIGGTPPYTITLFAGALPAGLNLAPDGTISGTPSTHDDFAFTVLAVDAHGCSSVHTYPVCDTMAVSLEPKGDPKACAEYARDIIATGGRAPYSFRATGLPPGLAPPPPDGKTIAGTPTAAAPGDYSVTIDVTDAAGCTASATFPLHVACGLVLPPLDLPAGMVGMPYHATITPLCGLAPFRFNPSIISPSPPNNDMPLGVSPPTSDGNIDGTPTMPGVYVFTVTVTDARNCTDTRTYSITICATPHTDITLPKGKVCAAYDYGPIPGTLVDPASLPPELKMIDGRLTGVPKKHGTFRFTMQLASPAGCGADVQSYMIAIDCPFLQLPDLPLPLIAGVPVSQSLAPSFCLPFQWKLNGKLPDGQTFNDADFSGILQVTPQPGHYVFTVSSVNSECPASRTYTVDVPPPPCANSLPLLPPSVPAGTIGIFYSQVFSTSAPVTFTLLPPNAQPPGLTFVQNNPTSATLSGFPTVSGQFNFAIVASNTTCTTSQVYTVTVGPGVPPVVDIPTLSTWTLLLLAMGLAVAAVRRSS